MPLSAGDKLGPYEIIVPIGAGGMGEVYRAHDTQLERDVAVKVLPRALANDPERLARFDREAKILAALNHPNIAVIYGLVETEGQRALAMEIIEGETLGSIIERGPVPAAETYRIGRQIAEALESAHNKGVVHRDLKPGNVMVTPAGMVKILDFGLAKRAQPISAGSDASETQTMMAALTREGTIMGTLQYMAPEQIEGKETDARSDIFALGVILYEMIAGKRPFDGSTQAGLLASILRDEPPLLPTLQPGLPGAIESVIRRCLAKDPAQRYQSASEVKAALEPSGLASGPAAMPAQLPKKRPVWIAAAATIVILGILAFVFLRPSASTLKRTVIVLPKETTFTASGVFAISPDGQKVLFSALNKTGNAILWLKTVDSAEPKPLSGTEHSAIVSSVFWAPDSRRFVIAVGDIATKQDIDGGKRELLAQMSERNSFNSGSWSQDGTILFGTAAGIRKLDSSGAPVLVTTTDTDRKELRHGDPFMLPDGHHFLYTRYASAPEAGGVFIGSLDDAPNAQNMRRLLPDQTRVNFVASGGGPGKLLFYRSGTLLAQSFDSTRQELSGTPAVIVDEVDANQEFAYWSVSQSGSLVYRKGGATARRILTWFDRQGTPQGTVGLPGEHISMHVSPDGTHVAYATRGSATYQGTVEVMDLSTGVVVTISSKDARSAGQPVWSADGKFIAWNESGRAIMVRPADLSEPPRPAITGDKLLFGGGGLTTLSPDGKYFVSWGGRPSHIWAMSATAPPVQLVRTKGEEIAGYVSANGRWIAYQSNVTGTTELWVQAFTPTRPGTDDTKRWMVSKGGTRGAQRWSKDGRELTYLAPDGNMMAVPVTTESEFSAGEPVPLFQLPKYVMAAGNNPGQYLDVTTDHQRFLISTPIPGSRGDELTVVDNWPALVNPGK